MTPKKRPLRKSSGRSNGKSAKLGRVLVDSAKAIARHMRGEIDLPTKVVRLVPDVIENRPAAVREALEAA